MDNYGQHTSIKTIIIKSLIAAIITGLLATLVIEVGHQAGYWNKNKSIEQFEKK